MGGSEPEEVAIEVPGHGSVGGLWWMPESAQALYVMAHGAGAGMRHRFMEEVWHALGMRGIGTLRFQFPYTEHGRRRPDHAPVLESTVRSAVQLAIGRAGGLPVFAGGKSMGGRMTSRADSDSALGVRGLVFVGFPLHPAGKPGTKRAEHLAHVATPMLFIQGTRDKLAELELLRPIIEGLDHAALRIIDGADHGFAVLKRSGRTGDQVLAEIADTIAAWVTTRSHAVK